MQFLNQVSKCNGLSELIRDIRPFEVVYRQGYTQIFLTFPVKHPVDEWKNKFWNQRDKCGHLGLFENDWRKVFEKK